MITNFRLRPIDLADTDRVHSWAADSRSSRFQAWGPNTVDETHAFVEAAVAAWRAEPQIRFHFSAVDAGLVVGAGEILIVNRRFDRGEIRYIVHPELWNRGYATKIASTLITYGFANLDLYRIEATCDPRNPASAAVLRKAGLQHEGLMRGTMKLRDNWRDSDLYAILATDQPRPATMTSPRGGPPVMHEPQTGPAVPARPRAGLPDGMPYE